MCDEDFDFDFEDDDGPYIDQPLHMVVQCGESIVGHLMDFDDLVLMVGGYYVVDNDDGTATLIEVPIFKVDPYADIVIVANADEMRLRHGDSLLTLAFINNIPFVCKSTRH